VSRTDYTMAVLSVTVLGLGRSPLRPRTYASVNGSRALTTGAALPSNINLYVIPLSLGDCSTATNKAADASRNNDHVSHMPSSQVAYMAYSAVC